MSASRRCLTSPAGPGPVFPAAEAPRPGHYPRRERLDRVRNSVGLFRCEACRKRRACSLADNRGEPLTSATSPRCCGAAMAIHAALPLYLLDRPLEARDRGQRLLTGGGARVRA